MKVGFLNCEIDSDISSLTLYWNGDICLQIHNWRAVWLADLLNFNEDLYQQAFQLFEDNGLKFYKSSSSKYIVSISKFRSPPPQQWWAGQNLKLVANRKISAAYVVRDSDCQVCGATWSQPSPFIKVTCSWRSLIFTNVHSEMNMEQNRWYEQYFDVLFYLMLDIYYLICIVRHV